MDRYPLEGFPERLRESWTASGLTQGEIAQRIGTKRKAFCSYINARSMPDALRLACLCAVFNVSADYLLFGRGSDADRKEATGMGRRKENSSLGQFHKDAMAAGLTYAEAQIQETCRMAGKVRVPQGKPGGTVYSKVSARDIMKRLEGQQIWKDEG